MKEWALAAFIICSIATIGKIDDGVIKENARQKTLIKWLCNDLPTHEACDGYQEEARNAR